jgi:phosphoribosylformylglycinamidine cyclo-ligase
MIHCSGGAQTKILHFIEDLHVIKNHLLPVPPLFELIQRESGTSWREMYQVFNCGHRMELYVPEALAESIIEISESFGIAAQRIGSVEKNNRKKLTISGPYGTFTY